MRNTLIAAGLLASTALLAAQPAQAQVTVYCSALMDWCQVMSNAFEKKTGIKVTMTQKGSGETLAQIRAEASNPKGDIWWGGTGDPHLQMAEENLSEAYRSPQLEKLHPWAQSQAKQSGYRTVGIYAGTLGFAYNTELIAKKKVQPPMCWADLLKPQYKDEVQISNPASSGTAYTAIATLVQLMGEDKAFAYLKGLHGQVNQYTRSGPAPARNTARGETMIGVMFLHDAVAEAVEGFPVAVQAPCEGTGYEIGSMSIIKGARNLDNAKKWYEFSLTPEAQALAVQGKSYQIPSNPQTPTPPKAPKLEQVKLIDYDFAKYGTSAERKRLIARWEKDVGSQPK
ncbi:ABC transporter substrate-binding protein [Ferrovibrio sp.]|uniref:ABC transporter substrate-binding protein n=1 Tax=Ferrovibrio sp. TaxID=1917215 RepID=UPI003D2CBAD6